MPISHVRTLICSPLRPALGRRIGGTLRTGRWLALLALLAGSAASLGFAQQSGLEAAKAAQQKAVESPAGQPAAAPGGEKPSGETPTPGGEKPAGEKPGEEKAADTVQRPAEPPQAADPKELEVRPDEQQRIAFSFRNQAWPQILDWYAEITETPLDWRELPADHVNIASAGRYTLDEVRDLLNRHLLARGFVMLQLTDGLMVLKTADINAALVPRVSPTALADLQPHDFVRVSLDVGWLSAEKLAEELKPMISANGKLVALSTTNRIEAMDAAINLLQIAELLDHERSPDARRDLAPEFALRHVSAMDAKTMLEQFLGLGGKEPPMTPQQMQMMQQMQQQRGGQQPPPPAEKEPEVSIVANPRRNSIILHAPPDRIAVAMEFLARIDVPSDSMISLADVQSRVEVFRLTSLDPEKLLEIINGMNILEPTTHIQVDKENKAIIVSGSGADRYIIKALIERLDGSGREFYVLQIRYRDPRAVAESIEFLIGNEQKEDTSQNRRPYYYFGQSSEEEKQEEDKFRVAADVRFKQILLWANEYEMEDVRNLLIKLGELPPPGGSPSTVRVIDAAATPETYQYLQQLREQFRLLAPNPVELPSQQQFPDPNKRPIDPAAADEDAAAAADAANEDNEDNEDPDAADEDPDAADDARPLETRRSVPNVVLTAANPQAAGSDESDAAATSPQSAAQPAPSERAPVRSGQDFDRLFGERPQPAAQAATESLAEAAPVRIEIDAQGRILLISPDTEALDQMESLILKVPPPQRPYEVFYVRHASAYWMELNLTTFFEDDSAGASDEDDDFRRWIWDMPAAEEESPAGLGASQPLKFVSDDDTNTIIVTGATSEQLRTIAELIALWDVPATVNKRKARYTKLVPVQYSRAEKIAETVKDAYRDLLSSNDKAFQRGNGAAPGQERGRPEKSREGNGSELVDQGGKDGGGGDFTFKGQLAVGVDPIGNTLLVSAEGEPLLELVVDMIQQLDKAARPQGDVQVHRAVGTISMESLEAALQAFSADGAPERAPARRGPAAISEPVPSVETID